MVMSDAYISGEKMADGSIIPWRSTTTVGFGFVTSTELWFAGCGLYGCGGNAAIARSPGLELTAGEPAITARRKSMARRESPNLEKLSSVVRELERDFLEAFCELRLGW
jgi:hypothetical protein